MGRNSTEKRQKSFFLNNMSHEIRTPLSAIISTASLLREELTKRSHSRLAQTIYASAKSLMDDVNYFLEYNKLESNTVVIKNDLFDLEAISESACRIMSREAGLKGLQLVSNVAYNVPILVLGDAARLATMQLQLLNNAVKFTQHGHVCMSVSYDESNEYQRNDGRWVGQFTFEVVDTGIGLTRGQCATLAGFRPFTQLDIGNEKKYRGTGMGLALVNKMARKMGGSVKVESGGVGAGTRVTLTIDLELFNDTRLPQYQIRRTRSLQSKKTAGNSDVDGAAAHYASGPSFATAPPSHLSSSSTRTHTVAKRKASKSSASNPQEAFSASSPSNFISAVMAGNAEDSTKDTTEDGDATATKKNTMVIVAISDDVVRDVAVQYLRKEAVMQHRDAEESSACTIESCGTAEALRAALSSCLEAATAKSDHTHALVNDTSIPQFAVSAGVLETKPRRLHSGGGNGARKRSIIQGGCKLTAVLLDARLAMDTSPQQLASSGFIEVAPYVDHMRSLRPRPKILLVYPIARTRVAESLLRREYVDEIISLPLQRRYLLDAVFGEANCSQYYTERLHNLSRANVPTIENYMDDVEAYSSSLSELVPLELESWEAETSRMKKKHQLENVIPRKTSAPLSTLACASSMRRLLRGTHKQADESSPSLPSSTSSSTSSSSSTRASDARKRSTSRSSRRTHRSRRSSSDKEAYHTTHKDGSSTTGGKKKPRVDAEHVREEGGGMKMDGGVGDVSHPRPRKHSSATTTTTRGDDEDGGKRSSSSSSSKKAKRRPRPLSSSATPTLQVHAGSTAGSTTAGEALRPSSPHHRSHSTYASMSRTHDGSIPTLRASHKTSRSRQVMHPPTLRLNTEHKEKDEKGKEYKEKDEKEKEKDEKHKEKEKHEKEHKEKHEKEQDEGTSSSTTTSTISSSSSSFSSPSTPHLSSRASRKPRKVRRRRVSRRRLSVAPQLLPNRPPTPNSDRPVPHKPPGAHHTSTTTTRSRTAQRKHTHRQAKDAPQLLRVLVCEDNKVHQRIVARSLKKFFKEVMIDIAGNGEEGLKLVTDSITYSNTTYYHFILMDCMMPVMDGYTCTTRIRAMERAWDRSVEPIHNTIIALTANQFGEDKTQCIDAGMSAYMSKPLSKRKLLKTLDKLGVSYPLS